MQRLADVKFKIHSHNTTQKTGHSSLVFVLWKPHSKRVTVGTFLQTISLPLADVAARGTTNHPAGRQRLRPQQQPKRQGAQRSTWRKSVLVRPAWQQAWTGHFGRLGAFVGILLMFRMFILSCSWKDSPNIIVIMTITMVLMIMMIMMIMMTLWQDILRYRHVTKVGPPQFNFIKWFPSHVHISGGFPKFSDTHIDPYFKSNTFDMSFHFGYSTLGWVFFNRL